jgi:hypothetical protein
MTDKALLVGVNRYQIPGSDLNGCVNDVTNIRDILLKYYGFDVQHIRVLTDERATRSGILSRLEWLTVDVQAGDRLLFHFSGHGSQIRDRDGDELKDRMDEIICPHDMNWDGNHISDDDLREVFSRLPKGGKLDVILDCCHAGTGTRETPRPSGCTDPETAPYRKPRFLPPPVDLQCRVPDDIDLPVARILKAANPIGHVLFAGCKDNQTSADARIEGRFHGAFSYFFCKHARDAQGNITRGELLKRVRASLRYEGFDQVPQLECTASGRKKGLMA